MGLIFRTGEGERRNGEGEEEEGAETSGPDQKLYYISEFQAYAIDDVGNYHIIICVRVDFSSLFTVEFFAT